MLNNPGSDINSMIDSFQTSNGHFSFTYYSALKQFCLSFRSDRKNGQEGCSQCRLWFDDNGNLISR